MVMNPPFLNIRTYRINLGGERVILCPNHQNNTQAFSFTPVCLMMHQLHYPETHFALQGQSIYYPFVPLSFSTVSSSSGANKAKEENYDLFNIPFEPKFRTNEEKYSDTFGAHPQIFAQLPLKILLFLGLNYIFYGCRQSSMCV